MPPPDEQSFIDRWSPLARQFARVPASLATMAPVAVAGAGKLAARETLAHLPDAVQQWARRQIGLPPGAIQSPIGQTADQYRQTIQDRYWSDAPFVEKAQKSAQDLLGGLWALGENAGGWHDYPGDDKPVRWTPGGLLDEVRNFAEGRTENVANLGGVAVGVPASMVAGLASDVATGQNRVLSGDPVGVTATLAPVAARGVRALRGKLGGPEVEARALGGEPLTMPLSESSRTYWRPKTTLGDIPIETPLDAAGQPVPSGAPTGTFGQPQMGSLPKPGPVNEAMAKRILPVAKSFVERGLLTDVEAAAALQKIVPWQTVLDSPIAQSAANAAVRMGKGAVLGMAVAGDPLGATTGAVVGALAPEAVRLFWRSLPPERQASIVRKVGGRGARYQQATEPETKFARQVIEADHAAAEGMGALGQAAAGEYLRSAPKPDPNAPNIGLPTVRNVPQTVFVDPAGEVTIGPRERIVAAAADPAAELAERRAEVQAIPELRSAVTPESPTDTARMEAWETLDAMEEQAKQRKQQIGNTQQAFDEGRYEVPGQARVVKSSTTSQAYNAQANEMRRLGLEMPPSEVAPHWWTMAAIEPVVDPRSPKFLRSARMRGALVKKLTAGMVDPKAAAFLQESRLPRAVAKKRADRMNKAYTDTLSAAIDKDLRKLSEESIGPRPLTTEYKLPDGRILAIGDLLEEVKNDPEYSAPRKPGQRAAYQEMVAETVGETYKAYGIKAGEVATLKHLELEAKRVGGALERDNADLLGKYAADSLRQGQPPPQATYANAALAADRVGSNPEVFGLTPEQGAELSKTLREQYIPTPELVKKFMQRGAEQGLIEHGAPAYMKRGMAESLSEHLAVNYAKDLLGDTSKAIVDASRRAKENLTALSLATKLANDTSNRTLQWISRGIDPFTYEKKLRATAARWTAIGEGAPADAYELQRQRSILKTGKLQTDMMTIEGKRSAHMGPTSGTLAEKARRVAREMYAKSDALPKLEETIANYDYMFDALGKLGDGKKVVMETGPNVMAHLERKNGVLELNGKPLTPEQLSDLVAKNAVQSSLRKFIDHGDVNVLVSAARRVEAGLITPFLTWSWGVKDIPGIKSGILGAVMLNDGPIWATTDPALQRMQWERAVKTSVRRSALNGAAWEAVDDHTDEEWRRQFGRAATPAVRQIGEDPLTDEIADLARYDWTAPSIALWRLGGRAAWGLKQGIDAATRGQFPGTTDAKLGTLKEADPKVLRAWSHFETGKGAPQDALDIIGFGGGIAASVLREYYKPGNEGNWQGAMWALSRAVVGGTLSDLANVTLAAYLPKASTRKLERPGTWSIDPASGELAGPVRWEPWLQFTLKKSIGLGFRTVNSLDEAQTFLTKAEREARKQWVKPLDDDVSLATDVLANAARIKGAMSEEAQEAAAEVKRLAEARAMAERAVTLTVAGYRRRLAKFVQGRMAAPRRDAVADPEIDKTVEDEVRSLGGDELPPPAEGTP